MKKITSLLIMAGGASSRMKRSLETIQLSDSEKKVARNAHKSLIPLGVKQKPLLFHLISHAVEAGYSDIYLITSEENEAFQAEVGTKVKNNSYAGAQVHFAIQYIPKERQKPLGTADAVQQAMDQYPELLYQLFTICNGDNLYSSKAFQKLSQERTVPHALISYARSGLQFSDERIAQFAVMEMDSEGFLVQIIEKPEPDTVEQYCDASGEIRVSMNIFSFKGSELYPFIRNCPIHPSRDEKELPVAVMNLVQAHPKQLLCIPLSEHLPDLTSAADVKKFAHL
jgi:NDP-sugar pyrophosphorylase family protein